MQIIKIMNDWDSYPLWLQKDKALENIDPQSIVPILAERFSDWDTSYQNTLNKEYPPDSGFETPEKLDDFERHGIVLWQEMQALLKETHLVTFYSQKYHKLFESLDGYKSQ